MNDEIFIEIVGYHKGFDLIFIVALKKVTECGYNLLSIETNTALNDFEFMRLRKDFDNGNHVNLGRL
jgi:hypothetical protein